MKKFNNKEATLDKLYFTNNIVETIHSKINYFLPSFDSTEYDFINSLNNFLENNYINNSTIIRKDFKSPSLLYLMEKEDINKKFKWLDNSVFKNYLERYINNKLNNSERVNVEELIKYIENDFNILIKENNNINKNNLLKNILSESMNIDMEYNEIIMNKNSIGEIVNNLEDINLNEDNVIINEINSISNNEKKIQLKKKIMMI